MKKLICSLMLPIVLVIGSCTMMSKGLAKHISKDYGNYTHLNISNLNLIDEKGIQKTFKEHFSEKTVYLYIWKDNESLPPGTDDKAYASLKNRFSKYPDVAFAKLYVGNKNVSDSLRFTCDESGMRYLSELHITGATPFIVGPKGNVLAYKAPKPSDEVMVDYVLFEARKGLDGTASAGKLIKGVNSKSKFKTNELRNWYINHFGKEPGDRLSFRFSTTY